jgi:hypothetical protein
MALKLQKTITHSNLETVTGEYWTINVYQLGKRGGVSVGMSLYADKDAYDEGADPLMNIMPHYADFEVDYAIAHLEGHSEKQQIYNRVKQDPRFAGAVDA